jgi:hypothetical protein
MRALRDGGFDLEALEGRAHARTHQFPTKNSEKPVIIVRIEIPVTGGSHAVR